ncbi:MAG: hypothetical protein HY660_08710 [Armatimonadetes bacterium]|nr:hypothetical protein [Armatimonadota bacterium]
MDLILIVDDDLLFTARLEAALREGGLQPRIVSPSRAAATTEGAAAAVVNVATPRGVEAVRALRAVPGPRLSIVGYCGHRDVAQWEAARAAGCDRVVPNAAVVRDVCGLLTNLRRSRPRG